MPDRWIPLDGVVNMRDLGGLPVHGGGHTAPGRLIRSDNLRDLSATDVETLLRVHAVTDVVDLRSEGEITIEGSGPLREHVPHHEHSLLKARTRLRPVVERGTVALPDGTDTPGTVEGFWAEHYLGYLRGRPDSVSAALRVVASARGAVVVHCAAGKDRTGTIVALALDVAGVPHEEIVADYVLTAQRIEAILARLVDRPAYAAYLTVQSVADQTPRAAAMEGILAAVHTAHGGSAAWLREQGWSAQDVERLRRRLVA